MHLELYDSGNVLDIVRALESDDSVGNEGWFLLSLSGRYLCSSDWIEVDARTKHELLSMRGQGVSRVFVCFFIP